jgi:TetR/AcrR family transcriptional regulator, regulator of cefoperazone and chloramphenicol sensitivity
MVKRAGNSERVDQQREKLVAAGYRVAVRVGMANLRTREVATEAGITVATLHYYFPTKHDLVRAVIDHVVRDLIESLDGTDDAHIEGLAWLRAMLIGLQRQALANPGRFRLLHDLIWSSREDPATRDLHGQWHARWLDRIAENLASAQRRGEIRPDLDPIVTAVMVIYLALGMQLRPSRLVDYDSMLLTEFERIIAASETTPPPTRTNRAEGCHDSP